MADRHSSSLINTSSCVDRFGLLTNISSSWEIVDRTDVTILTLCGESDEDRQKCIEQIEKTPENYSPPVLFAFATILHAQRRSYEETGFWLYFGHLRAVYDAARCKDQTVLGTVFTMQSEMCTCLIQETYKQDVTTLEKIMKKVIEMDQKIGHNYNPYWINSCGLQAMRASVNGNKCNEKDFSVPIEEWSRIAKETRVKFREMFEQIIKMIDDEKCTYNDDQRPIL